MQLEDATIQVLVVEDEILLAKKIALCLTKLKYNVVAAVPSAVEALKILEENPSINIAILDIMIEGNLDGIELAKIIKSNYDIPFIFLTSHTDRSIINRVKEVGTYAYLLKPFHDREVSIAIEIALVNFSKNNFTANLLEKEEFGKEENKLLKIKDHFFVKKDHCFEKVKVEDVQYLEADGNYTTIHTKNGSFLYAVVLKNIEAKFSPQVFVRVHRGFVVNINAIEKFNGNLLYINNKEIQVSKSQKDKVFKLLKRL